MIDYKYVFDMMRFLMQCLGDNEGSCDKDLYLGHTAILRNNLGDEIYERMV